MDMKAAIKKENGKDLKELVTIVAVTRAVLETDTPGYGDAFVDVLVEELRKLSGSGRACESKECSEDAGREKRDNLNFGKAIEAAKMGKKIARSGWNGKNQYVELAYCISYKNNAAEIMNANHCDIGNRALAFVGTSGVQIGWLASQADMLADDWYIVE